MAALSVWIASERQQVVGCRLEPASGCSQTIALLEFMEFCNQRRNHEAIGNVAPSDVYYGRRDEILKRREVVKQQRMRGRSLYNRIQPGGDRTVDPSMSPNTQKRPRIPEVLTTQNQSVCSPPLGFVLRCARDT